MLRRDIFKLFGGVAGLPAVKTVEQLKIEHGDAIVLKFPNWLTDQEREYIAASFKDRWNGKFKDVPVIILDGGADIEVLRKA